MNHSALSPSAATAAAAPIASAGGDAFLRDIEQLCVERGFDCGLRAQAGLLRRIRSESVNLRRASL